MSLVRSYLKRIAEAMLGSDAALHIMRRRLRGHRLVLAYHNVVSLEKSPFAGEQSLHLPLRSFIEQLDAIATAGLRVVALNAEYGESSAVPEIAITFDDGYIGSLVHAIPELARRGYPATVFIAPGILGSQSMWWDELAAPPHSVLSASTWHRLVVSLGGDRRLIYDEAQRLGLRRHSTGPDLCIGTSDDLSQALARHPGLEVGAHTWSHFNVTAIDPAKLEWEVSAPLAWLRERWGSRVVPWMAYPFGLSSESAKMMVESSGFSGAVGLAGGWHRRSAHVYLVPRFNVTPGLSLMGFRSRLAGFLPISASA